MYIGGRTTDASRNTSVTHRTLQRETIPSYCSISVNSQSRCPDYRERIFNSKRENLKDCGAGGGVQNCRWDNL